MKVWILMDDIGFDFESNIAICGVFQTKSAATKAKLIKEAADPENIYWIEEWEVE